VGSHLLANKDECPTATTEFFDPVSQPYTCENNKGLTPLNDKRTQNLDYFLREKA
jgi:hypothetical protein